MINNKEQLAEALSELLNTPVSIKILEKLTDNECKFLIAIMFKNGQEETIKKVLNKAKFRIPKKMLFHYRKSNDLDKELKKKPFDINYEEVERAGALRINDYSLI